MQFKLTLSNFQVSSIIYLDSPAGVGFSYSNDHNDYTTGDLKTASDTHTFLLKVSQYRNSTVNISCFLLLKRRITRNSDCSTYIRMEGSTSY